MTQPEHLQPEHLQPEHSGDLTEFLEKNCVVSIHSYYVNFGYASC